MTLIGAILKKVQSRESVANKYSSPPPELDESVLCKKEKKRCDKFGHVTAMVDSVPPRLDPMRLVHSMREQQQRAHDIYFDNVRLLCAIANAYMSGGKVDNHWFAKPPQTNQSYEKRKIMYRVMNRQNKHIYRRIVNAGPRVVPTARLESEWQRNKREMVELSRKEFVLFPVMVSEVMEDPAFSTPDAVKRPRVHLTLRVRDAAVLGTLVIELFTDVCPETCRLFLELVDGDGLGHGYVGTRFFSKVPHLFWSGGDVIYNNGFGCYAQRGRLRPVTAENYHFPHSMPGLLSMRTTSDGELCGIFNITFKALPQFDRKNVVFGKIIRPCHVYDIIRQVWNALSTHPVVEIIKARRRVDNHWVIGAPNTRLKSSTRKHVPLK